MVRDQRNGCLTLWSFWIGRPRFCIVDDSEFPRLFLQEHIYRLNLMVLRFGDLTTENGNSLKPSTLWKLNQTSCVRCL